MFSSLVFCLFFKKHTQPPHFLLVLFLEHSKRAENQLSRMNRNPNIDAVSATPRPEKSSTNASVAWSSETGSLCVPEDIKSYYDSSQLEFSEDDPGLVVIVDRDAVSAFLEAASLLPDLPPRPAFLNPGIEHPQLTPG
jgi:hypothetical protein